MFLFNILNHEYSHIHFIGIGGISMSGLAEILLTEGYKVSGSDMRYTPVVKRLEEKGAKIYKGHNSNNINGSDLIVYTDAISSDNPELINAKINNIPAVDRGTFLGQIMKGYENSIAVSGTHGKTTTTGMISVILDDSEIEPTILLGGQLDQIGGNVKIGKDSYLLTEACEYKGNILKFYPTIGIVLNIEEDHLDYFKNLNHIIETFSAFSKIIPDNGHLIVNNDDKNIPKILNDIKANIITYGINNDSVYTAKEIKYEDGYPRYKLIVNNDKIYDVELGVMGLHNIYNSIAAIAATHVSGVPMETIIKSIKKYTGTHRRLEDKGSFKNVRVIDDYAHHPTEIMATLKALKNLKPKKIWCVFQPHTYTRTKTLLNEFGSSFYDADKVIIADIYAAREKDSGLVHSKDLVDLLHNNKIDAQYFDCFEKIRNYLYKNADEGDIVVTMGAGDIYKVGEMLIEEK